MARPRTHDRPRVIKAVCAAVATGVLVKDACVAHGTTAGQLRAWIAAEPATSPLSALYARAREDQAHAIAEEAIAIADGADEDAQARMAAMVAAIDGAEAEDKRRILDSLTHQAVQRDKIRVDARKWMASKIAPRHYGEKLQQEISGPNGGPIPVQSWQFGGKTVTF